MEARFFTEEGISGYQLQLRRTPEFEAGVPEVLFEGPYGNVYGISYEVDANGEKFFLLKQPDQEPPNVINIVNNWTKELN